MQRKITYKGTLYTLVLNRAPATTKQVRRMLLEVIGGGWPIKWGHKYDIALPSPNLRASTDYHSLYEGTLADWAIIAIEKWLEFHQPTPTLQAFLKQYPLSELKQITSKAIV